MKLGYSHKNRNVQNYIDSALSQDLDKNSLSKLSKEELINIILSKADTQVPVSIFSQEPPPLESLVKFLIETKHMTVKDVASRLNRNFKTIWTTYHNSRSKKLKLEYSELTIPLQTFSKIKFSILESLTGYLLEKGLSISEISRLLNKDIRTIWTCQSRFMVKKKTINGGKK